jgi:hypothetical protein
MKQTLFNTLSFLFFIGFVTLVTGLIKPALLSRVFKREFTRKQVGMVFGGIALGVLVLASFFAPPPSPKQQVASVNSSSSTAPETPTPQSTPHTPATPSPTPTSTPTPTPRPEPVDLTHIDGFFYGKDGMQSGGFYKPNYFYDDKYDISLQVTEEGTSVVDEEAFPLDYGTRTWSEKQVALGFQDPKREYRSVPYQTLELSFAHKGMMYHAAISSATSSNNSNKEGLLTVAEALVRGIASK